MKISASLKTLQVPKQNNTTTQHMPTFETLIQSAPLGFVKGCNAVSKSFVNSTDEFNLHVKDSLHGVTSNASSRVEEYKCLQYILKSRTQATPKPSLTEFAGVLDTSTVLSRSCIAGIVTNIEEFETEGESTVHQVANTQKKNFLRSYYETLFLHLLNQLTHYAGKMENFKWRLGVAVSSSSCKILGTPYIAISFTVKSPNGENVPQHAELSYSEFQVRRR